MKYPLGTIFKDNFYSKMPWRVQFPKGVLPVKTKRDAARIVESLQNSHPEWFEENADRRGIDGNLA